MIKDNGWDQKSFQVIGTPDVAGYIPSSAFVGGGEMVTPDSLKRRMKLNMKSINIPLKQHRKL